MNRKAKISYREIIGWLLVGLSGLMLVKSITLCFSNDIWYDELFTVGMIEHSYGDLIAFTARDVHPPLYYCIVKFCVELCKLIVPTANTVSISKIVSVLPYLILLLYSVMFIRKRFGIFTGGLFLFCVIAMPQLSAYTVEIRMYSWALLFVTAAFLHAYGIVTESESVNSAYRKTDASYDDILVRERAGVQTESKMRGKIWIHYVALVLYGLAAAYTQYFACVAVIMVYLYVLVVLFIKDRKRIRQWLVCVVISIVGFAPWLYALYTQITAVGENYWILPVGWRTLGGCVKFLMKPAFTNTALSTVLAVVLFVAYICIFMWNAVKLCHNSRVLRREDGISSDRQHQMTKQWNDFAFIIAGIGVLAGLVLFGFAASVLFRPIFVYRYMIPALGCFWLSFAIGLGRMVEEIDRPTAVFLTLGHKFITKTAHTDIIRKAAAMTVCAFVLLIGLRDYRAFMGEEEYKILLMKDTNAAFQEIGAEDILIFNFDQVQMVTGYYLDNDSYLWYGQPEELIQEICGEKGTLNEDAEQIKEWLLQGRTVLFFGSFNSREDIVEEWRAAGLTVEETGSYLLERYWFNVYNVRNSCQQ